MTYPRASWTWFGARRLDVLTVLGFLLILLLVRDMPVGHEHREAGLYDVECPLMRLAAISPRLAPSAIPIVVLLEPAHEEPRTAVGGAPTPRLPVSSDARAPPAATLPAVRAPMT